MKTDNEAHNDGIDTRAVVADGIKELMIAFGERVESHGAESQFKTARAVWRILDPSSSIPPRSEIDKARSELIVIRDGFLVAARFDWAVLCSHAIWWLSVILEE